MTPLPPSNLQLRKLFKCKVFFLPSPPVSSLTLGIHTERPSKMVRISWLWHYIHYLSNPLYTSDSNPFQGTHCTCICFSIYWEKEENGKLNLHRFSFPADGKAEQVKNKLQMGFKSSAHWMSKWVSRPRVDVKTSISFEAESTRKTGNKRPFWTIASPAWTLFHIKYTNMC